MNRSFSCDISSMQTSGVYSTGNSSLINIMNQGNNYQASGNYGKAAVYHHYVIDNLKNNYNMNFIDNSSVAANNNNNYYINSYSRK